MSLSLWPTLACFSILQSKGDQQHSLSFLRKQLCGVWNWMNPVTLQSSSTAAASYTAGRFPIRPLGTINLLPRCPQECQYSLWPPRLKAEPGTEGLRPVRSATRLLRGPWLEKLLVCLRTVFWRPDVVPETDKGFKQH